MDASPVPSVGIEQGKDETYYRHVRTEIAPLLPPSAMRIVDIGCGEGRTAAWVKSRYPGSHAIGVEGFPDNEETLRRNVDEAIIADLNGALPDLGAPDLALFLDVLEHLPRPDLVLGAVARAMPIGGRVIVSVPNISNLWVSADLFFRGRFRYQDAGILDRTHMRFFDRQSAVGLLEGAGFSVYDGIYGGFWSRRDRLLNGLTGGLLAGRFAVQFIMVGEKTSSVERKTFSWRMPRYDNKV